MAYIGSAVSKTSDIKRITFATSTTGSGPFALGWTPDSKNTLTVTINGVKQQDSSFSVSGANLTITETLISGDELEAVGIVHTGGYPNVPADGSVSLTKLSASGTASATTFHRGDNSWAAGGTAHASQWHLTGYPTGSHDPLTTWAEQAQLGETYYRGYKRLGDAFTHASGVFTFPATGYWQVTFKLVTNAYGTTLSNYTYGIINTTVDGGTTWYANDQANGGVQRTTSDGTQEAPIISQVFFWVGDTSTHKIAFEVQQHNSATEAYGIQSGRTYTCLYFTQLAAL
jgi:hypothetical protein